MYRLVEECCEKVKSPSEERLERRYGFRRVCLDDVVLSFQACGDLEGGFARVYCDESRAEYLVAFSCARRGAAPAPPPSRSIPWTSSLASLCTFPSHASRPFATSALTRALHGLDGESRKTL